MNIVAMCPDQIVVNHRRRLFRYRDNKQFIIKPDGQTTGQQQAGASPPLSP
ncbi:hypothetical protein [Bradyrhizobium sp. USDA 3650]